MKTEYERALEERIASLETSYGYLKQKVDGLESDEDLEQRIATARKKLAELKDRGDGAWDDVKESAEAAWKDLEGAFAKVKRRFSKGS